MKFKLDGTTINALIQLGMMGIGAIQRIREDRASRKLEVTDGPNGPEMDDATFDAHFVKWTIAADTASQHASERIEDRHRTD